MMGGCERMWSDQLSRSAGERRASSQSIERNPSRIRTGGLPITISVSMPWSHRYCSESRDPDPRMILVTLIVSVVSYGQTEPSGLFRLPLLGASRVCGGRSPSIGAGESTTWIEFFGNVLGRRKRPASLFDHTFNEMRR